MSAGWKIMIAVAVAAMTTALATVADSTWDQVRRWEFATRDDRAAFFAEPGDSRIKLILVDQESLDWVDDELEYGWPWPRLLYKPIVEFCKRAEVKVLAFDLLFSERAPGNSVEDDKELASAIRDMPRFVGALFPKRRAKQGDIWSAAIAPSPFRLDGAPRGFEMLASTRSVQLPAQDIATAISVFGHVYVDPSIGNTVRRVPPLLNVEGHWVPFLGLAAYAMAEGELDDAGRLVPQHMSVTDGELELLGIRLPLDEKAEVALRFRADGDHAFEAIPAAAIIDSELLLQDGKAPLIDPERLKDCYVFLGASAPGIDEWSTPVKKTGPGVEVHATLLDNLLHNAALRDPPGGLVLAFTLIVSLLGALWMIFARVAAAMWFGAAVLVFVPIVFGFIAYPAGYMWPIVAPQGAVILSLVTALIVNYRTEGKQRRFIKEAFQHYLSPVVIEGLLSDPSKLELGGERRQLSIFFSDLQGFSAISENLDPIELTSLLNEYLTDMTDIILEEGGTLDKYEGDAIIAFWNAPTDQPDHALRACRTALRCQEKLREKRESFTARAGAPMRMRIGVHTGNVVVGNMGSRERFDYTVLGDAANLASRLEGANKRFGTELMVSEVTWSAARRSNARIVGRSIGHIKVVGREMPVKVLEPLGFAGSVDEQAAGAFEHAWHLCEERRWLEAAEAFRTLPSDPLVETYLDQLRPVVLGEEVWDGVWELTSK